MDLCRACMTNDQINFNSLSENSEILDEYNKFTGLNIDLSDGLPNVMCKVCVDKLLDIRAFHKMCLESDTTLKSNLLTVKHEKQDIVLNQFLDTEHIFDTLNDLVDSDNNFVNEQLDTATNNNPTAKDESDSDVDDLRPAAEDSDVDSEMDSDEIASRKYVREKELAKGVKKKKKNYTFPFKCVRCERGFRYEERLLGHMREHKGHRAAVCEFCNREYTEWSGLQKHINLFHKNEIKYICDFCGKKFLYESALETHKILHSGPRQHICEMCGKSFSTLYQLNKHKLAHTDETPFECKECGKKFKSSQRLKTHQYRHTGIKKFVCSTCGKGFTTSPELRQHLIVHSDKKEFKCNLCEQMFRQRSHLSAHKRSHMF